MKLQEPHTAKRSSARAVQMCSAHARPAHRRRRHGAPRAGFTLIEAIMAIVILAIAIPPMLWSIREAHAQRVNPVLASQARWLAAEKLEDILADRASQSRGYAYVIEANYPAETSVAGFPGFARSVTINETSHDLVTPGAGFKVVTVRVSWTDATSALRELRIATVVTDY